MSQDRIINVWQVLESERKFDASVDKPDDSVSNAYVIVNGSPELFSLHGSVVDKKKRGKVTSGRKSSTMDCALLPESVFLLSENPVCSFEGHMDDVLDLSWSQNQYFLSSSMDKIVRLWYMPSKSCLRVFSHNDYVTCI
jgi:WD40 repeat protein